VHMCFDDVLQISEAHKAYPMQHLSQADKKLMRIYKFVRQPLCF